MLQMKNSAWTVRDRGGQAKPHLTATVRTAIEEFYFNLDTMQL